MAPRGTSIAAALAAIGIGFAAAGPARAMSSEPVSLTEDADWVLADSYYVGPLPQPLPPLPHPAWPVVRLDVTNNDSALGVYTVFVGARPGTYDWAGASNPAMQFGSPWFPAYLDPGHPPYLPQQTNGDGTIDWMTELLAVAHTPAGHVIEVGDGVRGLTVKLRLPDTFAGYNHVYHFATTGPFVACGGGCAYDSVPILQGQTFSFYVSGGLASPLVYFDQTDFRADGSLSLTFNGGSIPAAVPEPGVGLLLGVGWMAIALLHRRRRA